jgi:hypothetical protein
VLNKLLGVEQRFLCVSVCLLRYYFISTSIPVDPREQANNSIHNQSSQNKTIAEEVLYSTIKACLDLTYRRSTVPHGLGVPRPGSSRYSGWTQQLLLHLEPCFGNSGIEVLMKIMMIDSYLVESVS